MPLGRKTRPTSAGAKLETQNKFSILAEYGSVRGPGILNQKTGMGYRQQTARMPKSGLIPRKIGSTERSQKLPDWLERELLRREPRRHSLALGDSADLSTRRRYKQDPISKLYELKMEHVVTLGNLKNLKQAFDEFAKAGINKLDYPQFHSVVKACAGLHVIKDTQIRQLFMKIDYTCDGKIEWHEFCTYMYLENKEKEETMRRSKMAAFMLPAKIKNLCRGEPVIEVQITPDGTVVTVREDGLVNYWSSTLQLKNNKNVFPKRPAGRTRKRATDFALMTEYNKLIIATGTREIQIYDFSSLEPWCQISALETVPLNLDYCCTGPDECLILYGDTEGCVNIILMTSVGETLRLWKNLPQLENMPNISLDHAVQYPDVTYMRWKIHQDWVSKVKYIHSIPAIMSASNHEDSALVMGCLLPSIDLHQRMNDISEEERFKKITLGKTQRRPACDQTVFAVRKGVMAFDFSKSENLLVTGGMDKLLRLWSPYMHERPTAILKGHTAPIAYLCIASEDGHIFSVSRDNTAKIWHIRDKACLFTANPQESQIQRELSACRYSPAVKGLYIATDSLALLSMQKKSQHTGIVSHSEPVMCCGYSEEFRQVVSCSEGSVVKVWDLDTGAHVFEYGCAHGQSAISCLAFDSRGRRLVTGGRDGCLKMWNFNNGRCIKIFSKDGKQEEICDCSFVTLHRSAFVISVGWGHRIDIYSDSIEETRFNQKPKPSWPQDVREGHKDDILCIAHCAPHLLATGSDDGEVIVWNVVSGRILCRFQTPQSPDPTRTFVKKAGVLSLIFLKTRAFVTEMSSSAWLISSGSQGSVNFWSVLIGGKFISSFQASHLKQEIVKLALLQDDSLLFTADHAGYISVYNVKKYALQPEAKPPQRVNFWRAHISSITGLKIIENDQFLLTSSVDCSVRLWNIHGDFIGTFGQTEIWNIYNPSSWKHPSVPHEVLVDPLSMPSHPIMEEEISLPDLHNLGINENVNSEVRCL
ncbi:cilia- and flagella-associated protein 337 isoform X1 [Misgurnus anguillicaudatus]|uniref:cilia- and flagella-associated protein 337 isoform X1 n=2 Tax=Misgurnus anguillicaudatus TaxID=75329 RepID=UPI003CCF42D8